MYYTAYTLRYAMLVIYCWFCEIILQDRWIIGDFLPFLYWLERRSCWIASKKVKVRWDIVFEERRITLIVRWDESWVTKSFWKWWFILFRPKFGTPLSRTSFVVQDIFSSSKLPQMDKNWESIRSYKIDSVSFLLSDFLFFLFVRMRPLLI